MPTIATQGIVLKSRNLAEADRVYTLFTLDRGKLSVLARGVRKISSKRAGNLDTANLVSLSLREGVRGFPVLQEALVVDSHRGLKRDLNFAKYGFKVLELLDRLFDEGEEHRQVFALAQEALNRISKLKEGGRRLAVLFFTYHLLSDLGYEPILNKCANCSKKLDAAKPLGFIAHEGGMICFTCLSKFPHGERVSSEAYNLLTLLIDKVFSQLQEEEVSTKALQQAENIFNSYSRYIIDREIKSEHYFN